jgi:hypothetical protein
MSEISQTQDEAAACKEMRSALDLLKKSLIAADSVVYGSLITSPLHEAVERVQYALDVAEGRL